MGIVDDLLKALDRIPIWKRLQEIPPELDALSARLAKLEEKLGGKWPPDVCKYCGAQAARLYFKVGPIEGTRGKMREEWKCGECGKVEARFV